jgi:uncharacterized protein (DUF1697 family)
VPRYVAFLGGINVGGHRVSMADLKGHFETLGLDDVSTYIASGNVLFTTRKRKLEPLVERHLAAALGYAVPTFVRTAADVVALADASPFGDVPGTVAVGFLRDAPPAAVRTAVGAIRTPSDTLEVVGRELWWHLPDGFSGSQLPSKALAQAGLGPMTTRNVTTVRKLAAKL